MCFKWVETTTSLYPGRVGVCMFLEFQSFPLRTPWNHNDNRRSWWWFLVISKLRVPSFLSLRYSKSTGCFRSGPGVPSKKRLVWKCFKTSRLLRTDLNLPPGKPPPTKVPYLYSLIFLVAWLWRAILQGAFRVSILMKMIWHCSLVKYHISTTCFFYCWPLKFKL